MSIISFDGRVAVVTGAGNGLGRDYCLELARRGACVVVNDLGGSGSGQGASHEAADQVVEQILAIGGKAVPNYDSVATREGGNAIIETAIKHFGRIDVVINNAGFLRNHRFEDLTDEQINAILDVHLKGAFYVSQPAYRLMKEQGYGRFVFTSSASALFGHPWQANYAAAKGGLVGLSNVLALEGLRHGILSNVLLPTANSRLAAEMDPGWMEVSNVAQVLGNIDDACLESMGTPAVNVPLALYLVSERSTSTHGIYSCNAGRYARVFIGVSDGYSKGLQIPTLEELAAHWPQVEERAIYHTPQSVYEEFLPVIETIRRVEAIRALEGSSYRA